MFDSVGLYLGKKFFGIVHKGTVYFKTNEVTRKRYLELGMKPFAPSKKQVLKNYFEVPSEVLENPEELREWVEESVTAV